MKTLNDIIALYKQGDEEVLQSLENQFSKNRSNNKLSKVVEISYRSNIQLYLVFSSNKESGRVQFLFNAHQALELELKEEIIDMKIEESIFPDMMNELMLPETKAILEANNISNENCVSILKLKEKDELTFLIETNTSYVFVMEYYWKS